MPPGRTRSGRIEAFTKLTQELIVRFGRVVRNETDAAAGAGHRLNDAKVIGSKTVANSLHILTQRGFGDSEFVAEIGKWNSWKGLSVSSLVRATILSKRFTLAIRSPLLSDA